VPRILIALTLAAGLAGGYAYPDAQAGAGAPTPYKLGTFQRGETVLLGLVLRDTQVVDIERANSAIQQMEPALPKLDVPDDMTGLIAAYDAGWRDRLARIAASLSAADAMPPYVHPIDGLKVLPPVRPALLLNAGGNYAEHSEGIARQQQRAGGAPEAPASTAVSAPGIWERTPDDRRDNPYLFLKSPTVVVGAYDPIVIPEGRTRIDYECEFDTVIGKVAKHVPTDRAADYIFGYTIQIDVSDRGGRGDRKMGGSDWLVGKSHDTFGPLGPFIVPKAFVADPMNVRHTFRLDGTVMQDSNTSRMSHNIYELLHYASNILTLHPGDVISGGSPAGTNIERAEPRWMRAGDTAVCTVEGIGEQRHQVVAEPAATQ